jgi:ferredoxin
MRKEFSTFMLFQDGSASPGFKKAKFPPGRWRQFLAETSHNILLAGGFPRLSPDLPFPLSPTLQMNLDLTTRGEGGLKELAGAELERINSVNFSSQFVDSDPRVCVLGGAATDLERFLATYGGVLEIEPILIKDCHPDFPGAVEASVLSGKKGYRVDFTVRSPIDKEVCTYCGRCGNTCPEACLSENLFVDYSRCTLCRNCEQICPVQAIDMSAVETRSLHVPAVVVLNGAVVDLPQDRARIFTEETLTEFFATISAAEIQNAITCDNKICQYAGRLGIGCQLCRNICPASAITFGPDGVAVNAKVCRECGACVAVCPTGALQYERFTDRSFYRYLHRVQYSPGTTVVVGSEEELHRFWWRTGTEARNDHLFFLEHPNGNALNGMQLLLLFARGAGRVVLLTGSSAAAQSDSRPGEAAMVNALIESLFGFSETVVFCNQDDVQGYLEARDGYPLPTLFADPAYNGRRPALAALLEHRVVASGRQIHFKRPSLPWFAVLECDTNRCSQCLACLNECKTAALAAQQSSYSLMYTPVRCIACGTCVQVCPEDALHIASDVRINKEFFAPQILAKGDAMICRECGKAFGTQKSYERVAAILARRKGAENGYLEYCDTCRVAKIFAGN